MAKSKKQVPNQLLFDEMGEENAELIIKVRAFSPMCKTLNGAIHKGSYLVKFVDIPVTYYGKGNKLKVKKIPKIA